MMFRSTTACWACCSLALVALSAATTLAAGSRPVQPVWTTTSGQAAPRAQRTSVALTRDMPVSQAVDILRNATTPPLNIIVYWKDLDANAGVSRDTTIGFDAGGRMRLRQYLDILTTSLSATGFAPIGYTVDRGVIVIATEDTLPKRRLVTRVYDVTDLVPPPSRPFFFDVPMFPIMMYGGIPRRALGDLGPYNTTRGVPNARNTLRRPTRRR